MSNNPNDDKKSALEQLRKFTDDVKIAMFSAIEADKITSRPMTTQDVDDDANIWFFTSKKTDTASEAKANSNITLIYAHPGKNTYLCVDGVANIVEDREKIKQLWSPAMKAWFPEGEEDPDLTLVKVTTSEAAYWDSAASKMVVFFSMIKAIVKGEEYNEGEHGKLDLK